MSVATISPSGLAQRKKSGKSCDLIDVRTPVEFREMHVEFARNVPLDQLDPESLIQQRNGNANEPLYVICQLGGRSQQACELFQKKGFNQVVSVEGGTKACEQTDLPLVRGKKAVSLERQVRMAAGTLVLTGVILGWFVHPAFYGLSAFVGGGLLFSGITNTCGMAVVLARMPWNR
jgi:rhodanese-related sulfurtransferase